MRLVIQRVIKASVDVDGKTVGSIGKGFLVLIGITHDDTKEIADKLIKKLIGLRIFEDENGKTVPARWTFLDELVVLQGKAEVWREREE